MKLSRSKASWGVVFGVAGMAVWLAGTAALAADKGVSATAIHVGQAAALKGQAAALGEGMQAGLQAYFKRVNAAGGVGGRQIELKSINDGYEPAMCEKATKVLLDGEGVFALVGYVGTPTTKAVIPLAMESQTPLIGPFTGAAATRTPFNKYVVNLRASYAQEMEAVAAYLVDKKGLKKIACLHQNDAFGQSGVDGITAALKRRGIELVAKGQFERNTVAVAGAITEIAAAKPEAIVTVAPYKPTAAFVRGVRGNADLKDTTVTAISFVGTSALLAELGDAGEGVVISQVVPSPMDDATPVVKEYHQDMKAAGFGEKYDYVSLEGYLSAKLLCTVLGKVQGEPTREGFLKALHEAGSIDLGGVMLKYGESDGQGLDEVWLTEIRGKQVVPLGDPTTIAVTDGK